MQLRHVLKNGDCLRNITGLPLLQSSSFLCELSSTVVWPDPSRYRSVLWFVVKSGEWEEADVWAHTSHSHPAKLTHCVLCPFVDLAVSSTSLRPPWHRTFRLHELSVVCCALNGSIGVCFVRAPSCAVGSVSNWFLLSIDCPTAMSVPLSMRCFHGTFCADNLLLDGSITCWSLIAKCRCP